MINFTMSLLGSAVVGMGIFIAVVGGIAVTAGAIVLPKIIKLIPKFCSWVKEKFIELVRFKGKPIEHGFEARRGKRPKPVPTPTPEEEVVDEEKPWPRTLKKIKIKTKYGAIWGKHETKNAGNRDAMFIDIFNEYDKKIAGASAVEFAFYDPKFGAPRKFMEFTINKGKKQPWGDRINKIKELILDIQKYANEHNGEFTEEECKEFERRAAELSIKDVKNPREVKVNTSETAKNTTFLPCDEQCENRGEPVAFDFGEGDELIATK